MELFALPMDNSVVFTGQVGDDREVKGRRICQDVSLMVQDLEIIHSFYPFRLGGSDIILGANWLKALDEVMLSWKRSTLKIDMGGEWFCLRGDPTLQKSQMSCKALKKVVQRKEEVYFVEFSEIRMTEVAYVELEYDVQDLLKKFPYVHAAIILYLPLERLTIPLPLNLE